jgi:hypothetical protein
MRESNSRPQFGKLLLYHLTNPAFFWNTSILAETGIFATFSSQFHVPSPSDASDLGVHAAPLF